MTKAPPPSYTEVATSEVSDDLRGSPWRERDSPRMLTDYDPASTAALRREDSKSSGSSGSSANVRFNAGSGGLACPAEPNYVYKDLPPGWEARYFATGKIYYCHVPTDTQHWNHPLEKSDLPPGWERVYGSEFGEYYVNHVTKSAQFTHPGSLPSPVTGEQHAQALAAVKQRKLLQEKAHSSTYVPPSQYLIQEIPEWLREYAVSPEEEYEWSEQSHEDLDKYQTMMTKLYKEELEGLIQEYEDYRNRIISELEERMQQHDLTQTAAATAATQNRETFV